MVYCCYIIIQKTRDFSVYLLAQYPTADWPIRARALIWLLYKAKYGAILGQWEREDFYNHLSNYTNAKYNSEIQIIEIGQTKSVHSFLIGQRPAFLAFYCCPLSLTRFGFEFHIVASQHKRQRKKSLSRFVDNLKTPTRIWKCTRYTMQMNYSYGSDLPFKNFCKLSKRAETIRNH